MTTARRRIPINNHDQAPGREPDPAGATDRSAGSAAAAAAAAGPETQAEAQSRAALDLEKALEEMTEERDALSDSLLRLRAEFDNYRKRACRDMEEARECSQGDLLADLLPVLDNLERALDAAEHHEEGKVLEGVRMVRDMFVALLNRVGVEEIETVGAPFDPQVHDAVAMQPSGYEKDTVAEVLESGYVQGGRVLRAARVIVSSGPAAGAANTSSGPGRSR